MIPTPIIITMAPMTIKKVLLLLCFCTGVSTSASKLGTSGISEEGETFFSRGRSERPLEFWDIGISFDEFSEGTGAVSIAVPWYNIVPVGVSTYLTTWSPSTTAATADEEKNISRWSNAVSIKITEKFCLANFIHCLYGIVIFSKYI